MARDPRGAARFAHPDALRRVAGSADMVFRSELDALVKLLSLERLPEYVFRLVYILVAALALLGVYLHAAAESRDEKMLSQAPAAGLRLLGFVESSIVLAGLVMLFAAFVAVQFKYFFGGRQTSAWKASPTPNTPGADTASL